MKQEYRSALVPRYPINPQIDQQGQGMNLLVLVLFLHFCHELQLSGMVVINRRIPLPRKPLILKDTQCSWLLMSALPTARHYAIANANSYHNIINIFLQSMKNCTVNMGLGVTALKVGSESWWQSKHGPDGSV